MMRVREAERPYLKAEALALADALPPSSALRDSCVALADAVEIGDVPVDLEEPAGDVLALAIETGRARSVHGPAGERALAALWRETPQGRDAVVAADELTEALRALSGFAISAVRVTATAPGAYSVSIAAGDCDVGLVFDRNGARLRGINVGAGGPGE